MTKIFDEARFRAQLSTMLSLQDSMNGIVFSDWRQRGLAWHRAIYVEAAEFLEHLGTWKWWKKGEPDFPQASMELVDIWHFALSWYIVRFGQDVPSEALCTAIVRRVRDAVRAHAGLDAAGATPELRHELTDRLVAAAGNRLFDTDAFVGLMFSCGLDFDELYRRYVGKNMLNRLRQAHGYKSGIYVKTWAGREDNVHLDELLQRLPADATLPDNAYRELERLYLELAVSP